MSEKHFEDMLTIDSCELLHTNVPMEIFFNVRVIKYNNLIEQTRYAAKRYGDVDNTELSMVNFNLCMEYTKLSNWYAERLLIIRNDKK